MRSCGGLRQESFRLQQLRGRCKTERVAGPVGIPLYMRRSDRRGAVLGKRTQFVPVPYSRSSVPIARDTRTAVRTGRDQTAERQRLSRGARRHLRDIRSRQLYSAVRIGDRRSERNGFLHSDGLLFRNESKKTEIRRAGIPVFVLSGRSRRLPYLQTLSLFSCSLGAVFACLICRFI